MPEDGFDGQASKENNVTRAKLDKVLDEGNYSSRALVDLFAKQYPQFDRPARPGAGYPLREHIEIALDNLEMNEDFHSAPKKDKNIMRMTVLLHDLRKPDLPHNQDHKEPTAKDAVNILSNLYFDASDINLARALIEGDPLGNFFIEYDEAMGNDRKHFVDSENNNKRVKAAAEAIKKSADRTDLEYREFAIFQKALFIADAGSYPTLGYMFNYDDRAKTMGFSNFAKEAFQKIEQYL